MRRSLSALILPSIALASGFMGIVGPARAEEVHPLAPDLLTPTAKASEFVRFAALAPSTTPPKAAAPLTAATSANPAANGPETTMPARPRIILSGPITLEADDISGDLGSEGKIQARGHVHITRGNVTITSDSVDYETTTRVIRAAGHVMITGAEGVLQAESLTYSPTGESSGTGLVGNIEGISVRAADFHLFPPQGESGWVLKADRADVTACTFDHPDFLLSARNLEMLPGKKLKARGAGLSLFGARLFTVPYLALSLKPKDPNRTGSYVPAVGIGSTAGLFTRWSIGTTLAPGTSGLLQVEASRVLGLTGGLDLTRVAGTPVQVILYHKAEYPRIAYSHLTIDKYPEVSLPLATSIPVGHGSVSLMGQVMGGQYHEYITNVTGARALVRGSAFWNLTASTTRPLLGIGASEALYSHDDYTIAGAVLGYQSAFSRTLLGSARFLLNAPAGHTPFAFDRVEVPRRLEVALESNQSKWGWGIDASMDLNKRRWYEAQVSVSRLLNCLRPSIGYEFRNQEVLFTIGIPALEKLEQNFGANHSAAKTLGPGFMWTDGQPLPNVEP